MSIPKHEAPAPRKGTKKPAQPAATVAQHPLVVTGPPSYPSTPSIQHDINHVQGLSGIEETLDSLASAVRRLTSDEHAISLSTGYRVNPVQVTLADNDYTNTMGDLVTAFQRIADSLGKLAGINRPRLEQWHEQDAYVPLYKDVAADGGAPGPAAEPEEKAA